MTVEGVAAVALIDTGAAVSVLSERLCRSLRKVTTPLFGLTLRTASAQEVKPLAMCTARVLIQDITYVIEFTVLPSCSHDIILGWDFLSRHHAVIDCARAQLELLPLYEPPPSELSVKLVVSEDTTIPPSSSVIVPVSCNVAPDTHVVFTPSSFFLSRKLLPLPSAVIDVRSGSSLMAVCNASPCTTTLFQGECLGCVEAVDPSQVKAVLDGPSFFPVSALSPGSMSNPEVFLQSIDKDLESAQRDELIALLRRFRGSFDCQQTTLGRTSTVCHEIDTGSHAPLRQRPYRVSHAERRVIDEQVTDMLTRNVIRPSTSPWASPVVLVTKKDGSIRFCVDYRRLNKITRRDVYPLPRIDDALDCLQGAEFFSSLDLRSGYWQVPMSDADRSKTAFVTPDGLYEFNVMPFGLCNAPATFERMMDNVLRGLKWKTCLCYLDDIVVFSPDFNTHLERLEQVLTCLTSAGLQLNVKKCRFAARKLTILGHVVSKDGILPD